MLFVSMQHILALSPYVRLRREWGSWWSRNAPELRNWLVHHYLFVVHVDCGQILNEGGSLELFLAINFIAFFSLFTSRMSCLFLSFSCHDFATETVNHKFEQVLFEVHLCGGSDFRYPYCLGQGLVKFDCTLNLLQLQPGQLYILFQDKWTDDSVPTFSSCLAQWIPARTDIRCMHYVAFGNPNPVPRCIPHHPPIDLFMDLILSRFSSHSIYP